MDIIRMIFEIIGYLTGLCILLLILYFFRVNYIEKKDIKDFEKNHKCVKCKHYMKTPHIDEYYCSHDSKVFSKLKHHPKYVYKCEINKPKNI